MKLKVVGKILKVVVLIVLCLIILIVAAGYIFLKTFDIKRYKSQIIAVASSALGRQVDFKDLDLQVSWMEGVRLKLNDITMSDDPTFQEGNFLRIREISLGADIFSYLMSRQVSLSTIRITDPEVKIIRGKNGQFNVLSIGESVASVTAGAPASITPAAKNNFLPGVAALPLIFIDAIVIENGSVTYLDRFQPTEIGYNITQVGLKVKQISLHNAFPFEVQAAFLSGTKNFLIAGTMKFDPKMKEVSLGPTKVTFDLTQDSWEKVRFALNAFISAPLPSVFNGKFIMNIKALTAGAQGLKNFKADGELGNGNLKFKDTTAGVSLEVYQMALKLTDFSLDEDLFTFTFSAGLFNAQPNVSINGTGAFNLKTQQVRFKDTAISSDLELLPLEKIKSSFTALAVVPFPEVLKGKLLLNLKKISVGPTGLGEVRLDADWTNGKLGMKAVAPGISVDASQVALKLTDFNLSGNPFRAFFQGAVYGDKPNVTFNGMAQVDLKTQSVFLKDAQISSDLGLLPLSTLKGSLAILNGIPFPEVLQGTLNVDLNKLSAGPKGLEMLIFDARLANGAINIKEITPGVSFDGSRLAAEIVHFTLFGEPMRFAFSGALFGEKPNFSTDGTAQVDFTNKKLQLSETNLDVNLNHLFLERMKDSVAVLKTMPLPEVLEGKLKVTLKDLAVSAQGLDAIKADAFLTNGKVLMKNALPGISIDADQIDFKMNDFSLGNPFGFTLAAAVFGGEQTIVLGGTVQYDLATQTIHLKNTDVACDLSQISLAQLKSSVSAFDKVVLPENLAGKLHATIKELSADSRGLKNFSADAQVAGGRVSAKDLIPGLSIDIPQVDANIKDITAGPDGLKGLSMDAQLAGGTVSMKEAAPGVSLEASHVDFKVKDLSLGLEPFQFSVRAAVYGEEPNVAFTSQGQFDFTSQNIELSNGKLVANLSKISSSQLRSALAFFKDTPFPKELRGTFNATIDELKASSKGLKSLTMKGELTEGYAKLEQLALPLESIHTAFKVAGIQAVVEDLSLKLGEGSIKAVGTVDDYLGAQIFNADLDLQGIDLSRILDQTKQPVKLEGIVVGKYEVKGQGFGLKKLTSNLSGSGNLEVQNGKLKDINLLKEVLNTLSMFPNLEERIQARLPEKYKETLKQKDTILKKVRFDSVVQNGAVIINPADVDASGFLLKGQGKIGLNETIAFDTSFFIVEDLTASMVGAAPELGYLQNDFLQIQFPLRITGKLSAPKVVPDLVYITQMVIKNRGKEELQKVLKKALGGTDGTGQPAPSGDRAPNAQSPTPPSQEQPPSQKNSEQRLIEGILNTIFKK